MNMFKKVITWAMLSIMMQLAGLLVLDQVVFKHSSTFETTTVVTPQKEAVTVSIPQTARDIETSYSGRYVSYYDEEDRLMLLNTKTSETKQVEVDEDATILYSSWVPKDNYLLIAEKVRNDKGNNVIKIVNYNARTAAVAPVVEELCSYQKGLVIDDIETSKGSGTKYIGVSRGGINSVLYRIDINDDMRKLPLKVPSLGTMKAFQHKDQLIYEDSSNGIFYSYNNQKATKLTFLNAKNLKLLAVDENSNIYMGKMEGDKVTSIIYGNVETNTNNWTNIALEKPKDVSDIYIDNKGVIMINDNLTGKVTNLSTKETITYNGRFIEITNRVITSSNDGTLYIKNLTDVDKEEEVKIEKKK